MNIRKIKLKWLTCFTLLVGNLPEFVSNFSLFKNETESRVRSVLNSRISSLLSSLSESSSWYWFLASTSKRRSRLCRTKASWEGVWDRDSSCVSYWSGVGWEVTPTLCNSQVVSNLLWRVDRILCSKELDCFLGVDRLTSSLCFVSGADAWCLFERHSSNSPL